MIQSVKFTDTPKILTVKDLQHGMHVRTINLEAYKDIIFVVLTADNRSAECVSIFGTPLKFYAANDYKFESLSLQVIATPI